MFLNRDLLENLTKLLAMNAVRAIADLDDALDNGRPGISGGASTALCPYFYQKAILTTEGVPADILSSISDKFLIHYEQILKITCNAGGFSNPISKLLFNARFSSGFRKSFLETKKIFDVVWNEARTTGGDVIGFLAYGAIQYCEYGTGEKLESPETILAIETYLEAIFNEVHSRILGRA